MLESLMHKMVLLSKRDGSEEWNLMVLKSFGTNHEKYIILTTPKHLLVVNIVNQIT